MRKRRAPKRSAGKALRRVLTVERLDRQGFGVAGDVTLPFALPGEQVEAMVRGRSGTVTALDSASEERHPPRCPHFGRPGEGCGGCTLQHLGEESEGAMKASLLLSQVRRIYPRAGLAAYHRSPHQSRRRARLSVSPEAAGFHELGGRKIVPISACAVLSPRLLAMTQPLRRLSQLLGRRFSAQLTELGAGPCVDLFDLDERSLDLSARETLDGFAREQGLARLSADGVPIAIPTPPTVRLAGFDVGFPIGGFLQATRAGEKALQEEVIAATGGAGRVADLFCGLGTFALPMAGRADILAADSEGPAADALRQAARRHGLSIEVEARDLFSRPFSAGELAGLDAVVFDPPRAGAGLQALEIAASAVPKVVAVSCNPSSLAKDLKVLESRYDLTRLVLVDQFLFSPHIEAVAVLERR
jgi:23S rRNA (uracil1939-C5)-methyltransferase